jgi:hypothetical protein
MKLFVTTACILAAASASAQEVSEFGGPPVTFSGGVETTVAKTAADKWGATTDFNIGINALGNVDVLMGFEADAAGALTLDEWSVASVVGGVGFAFGDQDNIFVTAESGTTLEDPAMAESIQLSSMGATVALGFTDISADVTDIENVQAAYAVPMPLVTMVSGDYNLDSKEWVLGGRVDTDIAAIGLGTTVTYGSASENFAFEADASAYGIVAYVNGDQGDMAQNVGASITREIAGLTFETAANYNMDSAKFVPTAKLGFNF